MYNQSEEPHQLSVIDLAEAVNKIDFTETRNKLEAIRNKKLKTM